MALDYTARSNTAEPRMLINVPNVPIERPPQDGTIRPTSNRVRRRGRGDRDFMADLDFSGFEPRWWMGQQGQC